MLYKSVCEIHSGLLGPDISVREIHLCHFCISFCANLDALRDTTGQGERWIRLINRFTSNFENGEINMNIKIINDNRSETAGYMDYFQEMYLQISYTRKLNRNTDCMLILVHNTIILTGI